MKFRYDFDCPRTPRATAASAARLTQPENGGSLRTLHIVSLSAVTWDFPLVGRTRMLTEAWSALQQPTTFVQIPSYRTAWERVMRRVRNAHSAPVVRPWPSYPSFTWSRLEPSRLRDNISRRARDLARQLVARADFERSVAVVVSPVWTPWIRGLPFRAIVYDCIDELDVHVSRPDLALLYREWENELIERATAAVASASSLGHAIKSRRPDLPVATIRNGVDVDRFQRLARGSRRPAELPAGRPLVGFVGALYEWVDWELIAGVAERLPECEFAFVGPQRRGAELKPPARLPNVRVLGPRPYDQVPAYLQAFDVCWVPFRRGPIAWAANPVKVYEYLALGKPVVSTPIADLDSFEGLVAVGSAPEEVASLLRESLENDGQDHARRVAFAQSNSWQARAAEYVRFLDAVVWEKSHKAPGSTATRAAWTGAA